MLLLTEYDNEHDCKFSLTVNKRAQLDIIQYRENMMINN